VSEVLAALLGVVVGSLATYLLDVRKMRQERAYALLQDERERRRRRAALATGLLLDLRTLESTLRQYYRHERPAGGRGILPSMFMDRVEHEIVIFAPETVAKVTEFYTSTRDFFALFAHADAAAGKPGVVERLNWAIRCKAAFGLQALPGAKEALVREGGTMPEPKTLAPVERPDLPPIPKRSFPRQFTGPEWDRLDAME
jgi:hypothetical protein